MISLKRYIESSRDELFNSILNSYRSCLAATAAFGAKACPSIGRDFEQSLLNLQERVSADARPEDVAAAQAEAEYQLNAWGDRGSEYLKQKTADVKDLMLVLSRAAEQLVERDARFATQFVRFSNHLRGMADLDDMRDIRRSLIDCALQLKGCIDRMTEDSRGSVTQLRAELSKYHARVEESERLALRDYLTGLDNRRKVEREIESRMRQGRAFTLILLGLNRFKTINGQFGHAAGDDVLRQFATELKTIFRSADIAGRWGGDEFMVVLDGALNQAHAQVARIREWVFGEYAVQTGEGSRRVHVDSAIGAVSWKPGETFDALIERAAAAMCLDKRRL